jgi:hypothetical protein
MAVPPEATMPVTFGTVARAAGGSECLRVRMLPELMLPALKGVVSIIRVDLGTLEGVRLIAWTTQNSRV